MYTSHNHTSNQLINTSESILYQWDMDNEQEPATPYSGVATNYANALKYKEDKIAEALVSKSVVQTTTTTTSSLRPSRARGGKAKPAAATKAEKKQATDLEKLYSGDADDLFLSDEEPYSLLEDGEDEYDLKKDKKKPSKKGK